MSSSHRDQHLYRKRRPSKEEVRFYRERPEDLQIQIPQPRRAGMPSMSSDDESITWSAERVQVELEESDQSDDALGEDVEITEGGWICRVERFQKKVDSLGRIHLFRLRKEHSSPVWDQDTGDARKPEGLNQDQVEKNVQQSIISCIYHTTRSRDKDLIEPETFIEIKSPLILEVLRKNTSYGQQV